MKYHKNILQIDCEKETDRICNFIREQTLSMRRKGTVIGISGGIDSAVCAALCTKALGKENVFALILPEKESNPVSKEYALKQAQKSGIIAEIIDVTPVLIAFGTYEKRDNVIRNIFPEYNSSYKMKITLPPDLLSKDALNFFTLTIQDEEDNTKSARLKKEQLSLIIAATSTKQRTRMMFLYYYAEKMNYFVCGTTNRSEFVQGFFVKHGDGAVDIEPIVYLYKTQVFQLADHLGVIQEIRERAPSPDTYSFEVSDEEFYFRMPYEKLDLLLYAWNNEVSISEVCKEMALTEEQVTRAFRDFAAKHKATQHLRTLPSSLL